MWEPAGRRDSEPLTWQQLMHEGPSREVPSFFAFCTRLDQQLRCAVYGEMISPMSGSTISLVDDAPAPVRLEERVRWSHRDFMRLGTRTILTVRILASASSSCDTVNATSQADRSDGVMSGNTILKMTLPYGAPRPWRLLQDQDRSSETNMIT